MMTKPQTLRTCALSALMAAMLLPAATAFAAEPSGDDPASAAHKNWQAVKVKTKVNGEETAKGHLLFTTSTEVAGAAFRCDKGKLIALLASEPVDFQQLLDLRFNGSEDWEVRYTLNGGDEKTEDWVQMYRGKIFMVREVETTRELFQLATSQGSVEFTRKYGKPVNVSMPAPEREIFDEFLQSCALKGKYLLEQPDTPVAITQNDI